MINFTGVAKARRNYEVTLQRKHSVDQYQNSRMCREQVRAYSADEAASIIKQQPKYNAFIVSRIVERP